MCLFYITIIYIKLVYNHFYKISLTFSRAWLKSSFANFGVLNISVSLGIGASKKKWKVEFTTKLLCWYLFTSINAFHDVRLLLLKHTLACFLSFSMSCRDPDPIFREILPDNRFFLGPVLSSRIWLF